MNALLKCQLRVQHHKLSQKRTFYYRSRQRCHVRNEMLRVVPCGMIHWHNGYKKSGLLRIFMCHCQICVQKPKIQSIIKNPGNKAFISGNMEKLHSVVQCNSCAKTMAKIGDLATRALHSLCTWVPSFKSTTLYVTLSRNCEIFTCPLSAVWSARIINWTSARCREGIKNGWP